MKSSLWLIAVALVGQTVGIQRLFSVPACETSSTAITSSACISGRFISLAQQDTFPKLASVSQASADLATKSDLSRKSIAAVRTLTVQDTLANAIPRAVNDLVIGAGNGLSQVTQAVNLANTTATRMSTDLGNQFTSVSKTFNTKVLGQLQAASTNDVTNINYLIRKANLINTQSAAKVWTSSLNSLISMAQTEMSKDSTAITDKMGVVNDVVLQVPSSFSISANNLTNTMRTISDLADTNMAPKITVFRDGMTNAVTSGETGLYTKVNASTTDTTKYITTTYTGFNTSLASKLAVANSAIATVNTSATSASNSVTVLASSAQTGITTSGSWALGNETAIYNATETTVRKIADTTSSNVNTVDRWAIKADGLLSSQETSLRNARAAILNSTTAAGMNSTVMDAIRASMLKVAAAQQALDNAQAASMQANAEALMNLTSRLNNGTLNFQTMMAQLDQLKTALGGNSGGNISSSGASASSAALSQLDLVQSTMNGLAGTVKQVSSNATLAFTAARANTTAQFNDHRTYLKSLLSSGTTFVRNLRSQTSQNTTAAKQQWNELRANATALNKDFTRLTEGALKVNSATTASIDGTTKDALAIIANAYDQISKQASATINVFRSLGLSVPSSFSGGENAAASSSAADLVDKFKSTTDQTAEDRENRFGSGMDDVTTLTARLRTLASQLMADVPGLISVDQAAILGNLSTVELKSMNASIDAVEPNLGLDGTVGSLMAVLNDPNTLPSILASVNSLISRRDAVNRDIGSTSATLGSLSDSLKEQAGRFNSSSSSSVDLVAGLLATANTIDSILEQEISVHRTELASSNGSFVSVLNNYTAVLDALSTSFPRDSSANAATELNSWDTLLTGLNASLRGSVPAIVSPKTAGDASLKIGIAGATVRTQRENTDFNATALASASATTTLYNALKATVDLLYGKLSATGNDTAIAGLQNSLAKVAQAVDATVSSASGTVMGMAGSASSISSGGSSTSAARYADLEKSADGALSAASSAVDQGFQAAESMDAIIAANERERANSASGALNSIAANEAAFSSMLGSAIQSAVSATGQTGGGSDGIGFSEFLRNISQQLSTFDTYMGTQLEHLETFRTDTSSAVETDKLAAKQGLQDSITQVLSGTNAIRAVLASIGMRQEEVEDILARLNSADDNVDGALNPLVVDPSAFTANDILALGKSSSEINGAVAEQTRAMQDVETEVDTLLKRVSDSA